MHSIYIRSCSDVVMYDVRLYVYMHKFVNTYLPQLQRYLRKFTMFYHDLKKKKHKNHNL